MSTPEPVTWSTVCSCSLGALATGLFIGGVLPAAGRAMLLFVLFVVALGRAVWAFRSRRKKPQS